MWLSDRTELLNCYWTKKRFNSIFVRPDALQANDEPDAVTDVAPEVAQEEGGAGDYLGPLWQVPGPAQERPEVGFLIDTKRV